MVDLGNLGGSGHGSGNLALDVNNRGQVVGESDLSGDTAFHAFLWTRDTGMQDLGTLPGKVSISALSINDEGTVVGVSLDANFNTTAFIRHNGVLIDLNTLVPANSNLVLMVACSINARGAIAGLAMVKSTGEMHAFLAEPKEDAAESGSATSLP